MSNLIDRQAAIDSLTLNAGWKDEEGRSVEDWDERKKIWTALINLIPSAQPEPQWIPCSERLPEELTEVNVTWENTNPEPYYDFVKGHRFTGTAVYFRGRWYWYSAVCVDYLNEYGFSPNDDMDDAIKVLAWMPLPEPYQDGKQDVGRIEQKP